jgi:hypothetical protein
VEEEGDAKGEGEGISGGDEGIGGGWNDEEEN